MIEIIYTSEEAAKAYGENGPQYSTEGAAAFDLRAMIDEPVVILPSEQLMIPTGLKLNMAAAWRPDDLRWAAIAMPRSGRGTNEGLCIANTVGLIDEDYQGEIKLFVYARPTNGHVNSANNRIGGQPIHIEPRERIAQLMFIPAARPLFKVVSEFSKATERGENGFGSTGVEAFPMGSLGEEVTA